MTLLLDHCVPRRYLRLLTAWGYPVELLTDHRTSDSADIDVIALAKQLGAALLTVDLDFANILTYPPEDYAGIVVMRYAFEDEIRLDATLQTALADLYREGLRGVLVIIDPRRYRIRQSI